MKVNERGGKMCNQDERFAEIREQVWLENIRLQKAGLITLTWGNVSQIDRQAGIVAIKPSGVAYETMQPKDIVIVDLDGQTVDGRYKPSSDLATHLEIYKAFPQVGGITHTHSRFATVFAQAETAIPPLGTTHADAFFGAVPCTRKLTSKEIETAYEKNTGRVICETFAETDPLDIPAVLVCSHGPFTFGRTAEKSVENAIVLEEVAMMAWHSLQLNPQMHFQAELLNKHYQRKHGKNAYYGQGETK